MGMVGVMTTITLTPQTLSVSFTLGEKVAGLIRDQRVPTAAVVRAGRRALGVSLTGRPWTEMLLDVDAPEQVAAALTAAR